MHLFAVPEMRRHIPAALGHAVNFRFLHVVPGFQQDLPKYIARKDGSLSSDTR